MEPATCRMSPTSSVSTQCRNSLLTKLTTIIDPGHLFNVPNVLSTYPALSLSTNGPGYLCNVPNILRTYLALSLSTNGPGYLCNVPNILSTFPAPSSFTCYYLISNHCLSSFVAIAIHPSRYSVSSLRQSLASSLSGVLGELCGHDSANFLLHCCINA